MFEKKKIREELRLIDLTLENNDNWNDYTETNNILKKKNNLQNFLDLFEKNCSIYNDIVDRKIDQKVERTKSRPIASNKISLITAWILIITLFSISLEECMAS